MTLDDFLRALENLIEDREANADEPGEGNFSCEECRACNHCRFCIGCDSCEDCTYCDECIDCTSATQSKRCVSCKKISYCEDSRECKDSRYLTLCVSCTNCVHCLACVGIDGGEFYVLNEKRTRKEYFAVLRQVQELMQSKMDGGWRPPGIGLASDIFDELVATRDPELTTAPWLEPEEDRGGRDGRDDRYDMDDRGAAPWGSASRRSGREQPHDDWAEPPRRHEEGRQAQPRASERRNEISSSGYEREPYTEGGSSRRPPVASREGDHGSRAEVSHEPPARDWVREPPEYGSSYAGDDDRDPQRERGRPRPRQDYGQDLGRDYGGLDDRSRDPRRREAGPGPEHGAAPGRRDEYGRGTSYERGDDYGRDDDYGYGAEPDPDPDVPRKHDQQPTQPFARREREPTYDPSQPATTNSSGSGDPRSSTARREPTNYGDEAPVARESPWEDSRGRTLTRDTQAREPDPRSPTDDDLRGLELPPLEGAPAAREHEPSSPWLDENASQAARRAKRGSLRQAGRPKRPPENPATREATGSYRTGSAPARSAGEGTHTGTGLRLGRKPKRR